MGKNQLELFCTTGDFVTVLDSALEQSPVTFGVAGLFETSEVRILHDAAELSAFIAASDKTTLSFLAVPAGDSINVQEVPQRKGSPRYAVDQIKNPKSVVLRPGRLLDEKMLV